MTQTIGGETIYGWLIYRVQNKVTGNYLYRLYGHGSENTPEGKLVDVTNHIRVTRTRKTMLVSFLLRIKLVLNANAYVTINDFYFVHDKEGVNYAVDCETKDYAVGDTPADQTFSFIVEHKVAETVGESEGVLVRVCGVCPSFCEMIANSMQVDYNRLWKCMEPVVAAVTEQTPVLEKHDKTFDLNRKLSKCYDDGTHLYFENPDYDVFYPLRTHDEDETDTLDSAWNLALYYSIKPTFTNPS